MVDPAQTRSRCPHLDATLTLPDSLKAGKLAGKDSRRRGRQRKNKGTETPWGAAAKIAIRRSYSICDSKPGLRLGYSLLKLCKCDHMSEK